MNYNVLKRPVQLATRFQSKHENLIWFVFHFICVSKPHNPPQPFTPKLTLWFISKVKVYQNEQDSVKDLLGFSWYQQSNNQQQQVVINMALTYCQCWLTHMLFPWTYRSSNSGFNNWDETSKNDSVNMSVPKGENSENGLEWFILSFRKEALAM